jgi:hypothetical protein
MILYQCERCKNTSHDTMKIFNETSYEPLMVCNVCEKRVDKVLADVEIKQEKLKEKAYLTVFLKTPEKKDFDYPPMYEWVETNTGSSRLQMTAEYKKHVAEKNHA